jgi:hypothetical protein
MGGCSLTVRAILLGVVEGIYLYPRRRVRSCAMCPATISVAFIGLAIVFWFQGGLLIHHTLLGLLFFRQMLLYQKGGGSKKDTTCVDCRCCEVIKLTSTTMDISDMSFFILGFGSNRVVVVIVPLRSSK